MRGRENKAQLVSIVIPVYNVAEYLSECLKSVCAQNYTNLEIVLVDDGSKDESPRICDEWAEKDNRIKVIHKPNGGVSSARNAGLDASTGELIGFIDGDDWISEKMFEKLLAAISEADMACCGFMEYPMGDMSLAVPRGTMCEGVYPRREAVTHIYHKGGYFTSLWNKLFRREIIMDDGKITHMDERIAWGEDELWLSQILSRCKRVSFIPEALYYWRPRSGSITREETITSRHLTLLEAKRQAITFLPFENRELAKVRMYDDCFSLKVIAYCTSDSMNYKTIESELRPLRKYWLRSSDSDWKRKLKIILIEMEMKMGLPGKIIMFTDAFRRYGRVKKPKKG